MKNIHVLATYKSSKLLYNHTLKSFCFQKKENGMFVNDGKVSGASFWSIEKAQHNGFCPQHIYITSDEEIKEGDWFWKPDCNMIFRAEYTPHKGCQKIILTTDQDLIKDGVQAISNEFLQWFVKNPSCEEVEVILNETGNYREFDVSPNLLYKIIIPNLEVWKDVPEFDGYYQVSDLGNVRSLNYGKIRELKPRLVGYNGNQYLAVNLSKEGEVKSVKIHKLVALCFLNHTSKGYDGLVIDHIDSNKLNNRLDNLKLVTPRFNASKDKQGSSSKYTGVTWHKKSKKWQCQIYDNGKLNHLGLFNTEIEASETYNNYLENMTKEEPKQIKCYCGHTTTCDCSPIDEPKDVVLGYKTSLDAQMLDKIEHIDEAFGLIYVLETLLDFAGEDNATSINISTTDAVKIIKLLKQVK